MASRRQRRATVQPGFGALLSPIKWWLWPVIGGLSALGFQPIGLWPISLLAFAFLILQLPESSAKRAFWAGWLFGVGHFTVGLRWIAVSFAYQAAMPTWLGYFAVVALSLYLALFPAVATLSARWITGSRRPLALAIAFAATWIVTEYLRSQLFSGFAWNPLAVLAVDAAWVVRLVGTYGLSGLLILLCGALALCLHRDWRRAAFLGAVPLFALGWGLIVQARDGAPPTDQPITIVQPNINQDDKQDPAKELENIRKLARLTVGRAEDVDRPRLVFWPEAAIRWSLESGYPDYVYRTQPGESAVGTRMALAALIQRGDILLTGADKLEFGEDMRVTGAHNSVFALSSGAEIIGSYDKAHLVPYGEYLPMRSILEPLGLQRLVPGSIDFWSGPGPANIDLGSGLGEVALQVCYEIIFSGEVVQPGTRPRFIFNPSNDAWFGPVGPPQHLAQARLRAIEQALPVIRSTPTGISAVIDADGRIVQTLPLGTAGRIDAMLPMAGQPTLFSAWRNILPLILAALLLGISLVAKRRAKR